MGGGFGVSLKDEMKTTFSFFLIVVVATLLVAPSPARAGERTIREILREFFPGSDRVTYIEVAPPAPQRATIEKQLGYRLPRASYYFYVATTKGRVDGYAFVDDELGQHEPITFAVRISGDGVVERQEVLAYREAWGGEIRDPRFRRQFVGKTLRDAFQLRVDIDAISGATISSAAMARGVKRALVLFDAGVRTRTVANTTR